jgi:hypothetical protein
MKIQDEKDLYKPIRKYFLNPPFEYEVKKNMSHIIGDPDLEIYRNNGTSFFIETKKTNCNLEYHQIHRRNFWMQKGFKVYVVKDNTSLREMVKKDRFNKKAISNFC